MTVYYNENDPYAARWLRSLAANGLVPAGTVDDRSILDIDSDNLAGYAQCHFFAGIGGWPLALELAGWGDRPVWTASLPCQPYSSAGRRRGAADERDLWPVFFRLVQQCRPAVIFGEQVASADVIGCIAESDENMQDVLDREAVLGILRELERSSAARLQRLRPGEREEAQAGQPGVDPRPPQEMAAGLSRACLGERGEASGQGARDSVRSFADGYPAADRCGALRANGHSLQSGRAESVERAVPGSAEAWGGLHQGQRESGSPRAEHDGECLGREPHRGDCQCDHCAAHREIKRLVACDRRSPQGADRLEWLTRIRDDLDGSGYAFGACVAPACSVGAPHIRQRLFWVADSRRATIHAGHPASRAQGWRPAEPGMAGPSGGLADADEARSSRERGAGLSANGHAPLRHDTNGCGATGGLADAASEQVGRAGQPWPHGFWQDSLWLPCLDGKARRTQPGIFPLAARLPAAMDGLGPISRTGTLKGAGNAIVPQVAAEFIRAVMDILP